MAKPRVLIANRGEIAVRIIRTVRELGYTSIAVYSDADRDALHVEMADQAHRIGPALAADSYLSIGAILEAASRAKATMIHPGYGFLSERAHFARAVADSGFTFIGPPADAIEMMGDKSAARRAADRVGVPIVPGTPEPVTIEQAPSEAERIGFPVLVKAAFGGGGKGMQAVRKPEELEGALARATREAQAYFGRPEVFLEIRRGPTDPDDGCAGLCRHACDCRAEAAASGARHNNDAIIKLQEIFRHAALS